MVLDRLAETECSRSDIRGTISESAGPPKSNRNGISRSTLTCTNCSTREEETGYVFVDNDGRPFTSGG